MLITLRVDIEVDPTEVELAAIMDNGGIFGPHIIPGTSLYFWLCREVAIMRLGAVSGVQYAEVGDEYVQS